MVEYVLQYKGVKCHNWEQCFCPPMNFIVDATLYKSY